RPPAVALPTRHAPEFRDMLETLQTLAFFDFGRPPFAKQDRGATMISRHVRSQALENETPQAALVRMFTACTSGIAIGVRPCSTRKRRSFLDIVSGSTIA